MYRDYFVTADWLHTHLNDDNLVVLDVSKAPPGQPADCHQLWLEHHIPGAHYFDLDKVADLSSPLPHMLPSPEVFAQAAGEFGIDNDTMVIIYDQGNLFSAPRAWWTLKTFGVKNLRILQGGLNAWAGAGYTTESGDIPLPQAKTFVPEFQRHNAVNKDDVLLAITDPEIQIVDARSADRFQALAPDPRPGVRSGHIPGSCNVPWNTLVENGIFKSPTQIQQIFRDAGVDLSKYLVVSCGSGMTAAILLLALTLTGHQNVRLYDGSWAEWGGSDTLPVEP